MAEGHFSSMPWHKSTPAAQPCRATTPKTVQRVLETHEWWGDSTGMVTIPPGPPPTLPPRPCSHLPTDLLRGSEGAWLLAAAIRGPRLDGSVSPQLHWHLGLRRSSSRPPSRLPPPAASSAWHCSPLASQPGSAPCRPPRCSTSTPPCHLPWHHACLAHPAGTAVPLLPPTSCTPTSQVPSLARVGRARQSRLHSGLSPVPLNEASLAGSSCSQPCTLQWAALPSLRAPLPVWSGPGAALGA